MTSKVKFRSRQDIELCKSKFPNLICIPVAAQFMPDGKIALFSFEQEKDSIKITSERHYELVDSNNLSDNELENYKKRK